MTTYTPYSDFTAQGQTVSALMSMYAHLEKSEAPTIEITPIVVFLAFSIESYLNSIGSRKILAWDELERLPWKNKMSVLHKAANKQMDWGQDPLQFASEVFKLRDRLAHGKPERVIGPTFTSAAEAENYPFANKLQPDWYAGLTKEWAMSAKRRFNSLMVYLGNLYSLHASDHLMLSSSGFLVDDGK